MMRRLVKEFLRAGFNTVHRWLPKCDYAVVYGWPDFEDSSLALQRELQKSRLRRVILFVSAAQPGVKFALEAKVKVVRKDSLVGGIYFLFARYVFFTHPCFVRYFPDDVVAVNVWHGMPMKRIGRMLKDEDAISANFSLATSEFWRPIMDEAMRPTKSVLITGLPRNDRLWNPPADLWARLGAPAAAGCGRVVAWLPTYRQSVVGKIRLDGQESGSVFGIEGLSVEDFNAFLCARNAFGIVKPHPMARFVGRSDLSHLRIVDDAQLQGCGISLYEVLGASDVLVTDISSVYIDFLLLDRPIIHSFADLAEYDATRGFSVSPVTDYFAGPLVTTAAELLSALGAILSGEDPEAEKRRRLRALFHRHLDAGATLRLLEGIGLGPC